MVGMEIPTLLLLILLALCLFVGFVLGYARAILRSTERERSGQAQSQAAEWQAKAAEASGRADVLERKNAELAERARSDQSLAQMITPLSAQLRSMTEQVTAMQTRQASHDAAIREQLSHAAQTSEKLAHETASLSRALTSVSARGTWGEVELRRIVEASGMLPHVDFSEQQRVSTTTRGSSHVSDSASRPDLTIHLPGGAHIAVDAKVPLSALLEAYEIEGIGEQDLAKRSELVQKHADALRTHVKELAKRNYPGEFAGSPEITVLFLPAESLLSEALTNDPSLLEDALRQKVALATPSSLLALLRSVAAVWSSTQITQEAQAILELGRTLAERLGKVAEHLDSLGSSLRTTVDRYNKTVGSLEKRVLVTARDLTSLDAKLDPPRPIEGDAAQVRKIAAPQLQFDASQEPL